LHEILHTLGFWHEHSRCDRYNYISILGYNIETGAHHNFDIQCGARLLEPYDEGSVMHYRRDVFGIPLDPNDPYGPRQTTILSRRGLDNLMGQRSGLSLADRRTINRLYPPPAPSNVSISYQAGGPLVSWIANPGAIQYGVYVSIVVTEYDDVGLPIVVYEEAVEGGGVTTGTSIVDNHNSYTGITRCSSYRLTKDYTYAVYAVYPDNAVSPTLRVGAAVASCAPPPEEPPPDEPPPGVCWDGAGFEYPC
jgi:hypothetical protein